MPEAFKKETQTARRGSVWALVALLVALFVWGAFEVVTMPLETGEVYPEYSSLRADPLGAKALYESLDALPELSVSRLFKDRSELDSGTALVVLGVGAGSWTEIPQNAVTAYENLLAKGGRLAIAFLPMRMPAKAPSSVAGTEGSVEPSSGVSQTRGPSGGCSRQPAAAIGVVFRARPGVANSGSRGRRGRHGGAELGRRKHRADGG